MSFRWLRSFVLAVYIFFIREPLINFKLNLSQHDIWISKIVYKFYKCFTAPLVCTFFWLPLSLDSKLSLYWSLYWSFSKHVKMFQLYWWTIRIKPGVNRQEAVFHRLCATISSLSHCRLDSHWLKTFIAVILHVTRSQKINHVAYYVQLWKWLRLSS